MAPAVQKRSKNAKKQQLKPQAKKIAKVVEKVAEKKKKGAATKKAAKQLSEEEEDSPMEDLSEADEEDDVFKKLQRVMDEEDDSEDEKEEKEGEDSDSDLPSDFEREMAVDSDMGEVEDDDEEGEESLDKIKKDAEQHKKELEELKERDPEFYEFLQKEDGDLLGFGESEDEEDNFDDEEDQENEQEYSDMEEPEENTASDVPVLSKATLNEWIENVKSTKDFKAFKKLLTAFKTAARMSEEDDKLTFVLKIEDPAVFSKVISSTLRLAPVVFSHHLKPKKENGSILSSGRWTYFKSYVKSYLNNLNHLVMNLTDADMLRMAIREAEKVTNLYVCFERLAKEYLKILLNAWSTLGSADTVRIQAFLAIKSLAVAAVPEGTKSTKPQGYLDLCLKNVYLTFVKNCKNTNLHTLPVINLMRNLAVQLYGINLTLSYQQGFVYIRQLAIHLRQAMKVRSTKNHNMVYNWQYIHCIDFWSDVLNAYAVPMVDEDGDVVESPLKALIYPLSQVAVGTIQLIPTAQFYPLRFHVIRSLNSLIHNTNVFVPLATYVLEVLEGNVAMEHAKKSASGVPVDWDLVLKVHKKSIHGRMYQDEVLDQCAKALKNYYKEYSHHISFPEMVDADIIALKRFVKQSKSIKGKEKLSKLAKELEAKSKFVRQQRSKINFSPENEAEIEQFNKDLKAKMT